MFRKLILCVAFLAIAATSRAETGTSAWLRYATLDEATARRYRDLPPTITLVGNGMVLQTAQQELVRGIHDMLGRTLQTSPAGLNGVPTGNAIVLGTLAQLRQTAPQLAPAGDVAADGYRLRSVSANGASYLVIAGDDDRAVLYGAFALLRKIALGEAVAALDERQSPSAPLRWVNQWDNLDGTIERGYGGRSIFWDAGHARGDLSRAGDYARLLASLGINGCAINNVNANPLLLSSEFISEIARIADAFRPWGVRIALSIDFGSPQTVGRLPTYDPLDPAVSAWWRSRADDIYRAVPDFGGFVLKADSEGRVGPSTYGRTHADAANVVARALKPHGGVIFYRGFVYDHHMDWENPKNDRARAAYDNFTPLDGQFDDNVVVQIKNGPIDFQVREPASPLFGGLDKTHSAIELQVTQEYMGQARHLVFLVPMWKETLDFDLRVRDAATPVKGLVSGFVGVVNAGLSDTWFGNHLSQANLYGFGRLAWNPGLSATQIADEWTRLTFGSDPKVVDTIGAMQLRSWRTYENYTGPLGLQTLTDIVGNHYGVAVEASERNGWGQWHRADDKGVGMDRTLATGTGFIGQYHPAVARVFEYLDTCPDDLVLFMHHVPYTYRLHSGKTVIQSIYDAHYEGADAVAGYVRDWTALKGRVDDQRYAEVLAQLEYQAGQAIVWRDAVTMWFFKTSGIPDGKGRVDHYPGRIEAEAARLSGYVITPVTPWEAASGQHAVECPAAPCTAMFKYEGPPGRRDIIVQYFDVNAGVARFRVRLAGRLVDQWAASDTVPTRRIDSSSSARRVITGLMLRTGDEIEIEGTPDGGDTAALDYLEITSSK